MTDHETLTPTYIAAELGIQAITLRRWCVAFAAHLSPLANPGSGQARKFTGKDLEVLRYVRSLRESDRSLAEISELLVGQTFAEIDQPGQVDTNLSIVDLPDTRQETPTNALLVSTLDAMQRRLETLEQAKPAPVASQRDAIYYIAVGFVGALLFVILLLLLFMLRNYF